MRSMKRRDFLRIATTALAGGILAACQPKVIKETVEVEKIVKETVPVEKIVEKVVKETVIVEGTPKVVTKVVTQPALREVTVTWATDHLAGARGRMTKFIQDTWKDINPKIKVKLEPISGDDYWAMMDTKMAAGTVSDIVLFEGTLTGKYAELGGFLAVNEFMDLDNFDLDEYYHVPGVIEYMGQYFGLPYQLTPFGWFYNKTLLEKEGQPLPEKDWTWDDVLTVCKAVTKDTNGDGKTDQWGLNGDLGSNPAHWWAMIANGGRPYNEDHTKTTLNDPKVIEAFQWQIDMVYKHKVHPTSAQSRAMEQALGGGLFQMGKVAFQLANTGSIGNWIKEIADKFEWDLMPLPIWAPTGRKAANWNDQPHVLTRSAAGHAYEAWQFLKFLSGPEVSHQAAIERGWTPVHKSTAESDTYLSPPPASMRLIIDDWIPNSFDSMFFDRWLEWHQTVYSEIDVALAGQRSVKEALERATVKGDEVLAKGPYIGGKK